MFDCLCTRDITKLKKTESASFATLTLTLNTNTPSVKGYSSSHKPNTDSLYRASLELYMLQSLVKCEMKCSK